MTGVVPVEDAGGEPVADEAEDAPSAEEAGDVDSGDEAGVVDADEVGDVDAEEDEESSPPPQAETKTASDIAQAKRKPLLLIFVIIEQNIRCAPMNLKYRVLIFKNERLVIGRDLFVKSKFNRNKLKNNKVFLCHLASNKVMCLKPI